MRKVKLQMQLSVDGFVGGPAGEMDFMVWNWDQPLQDYVGAITDPISTILLGRKMAAGFMAHWAGVAANPADPAHKAGIKFHETPKIVFSRTIDSIEGNNVTVQREVSRAAVDKLKAEDGGDIMLYGGATLASEFVRQNLIDEYCLFLNPAAIGTGLSIFKTLESKRTLKLIESRAFDCGIVAMIYKPA